jgi:hypothetical protein
MTKGGKAVNKPVNYFPFSVEKSSRDARPVECYKTVQAFNSDAREIRLR